MVKINTNLQSMIVQNNLAKSTTALNQAIERMTTGFKINHASDNAANYAIASSMESKLSSLDVASDNVATGIDLIQTATDNLDLVNSHLTRIRDLMEQSANGTYGEESRRAIQAEVDSRLEEINRIVANCEFNGIQIFNSGILPSAAKVKLTDFGMSAGSIDFEVNGNTRSVNLTENDTLFSLMTKMDAIGVKSNFEDSTGMFTVNLNASAVTDNGTNFKSILGLEDTDGYRTDVLEEDVQKTETLTAQLDTRLDAVGVTNGNFTIVDEDGFEEYDSISVTSTIQDLFDKLAEYNITGSLDENGVITLDTDGHYIKGALANQLGINYTETKHNEYEGITTNTSKTLSKTVSTTATSDTTMGQLGITAGDTLQIRNNNSEILNVITADESILNQSVGTFLNNLVTGGYLTSASITDGVISLSSDIHNYVEGTIASKLGIGVITEGTGITNAVTQTSSGAVTYSVSGTADGNTTFADLEISTSNAVTVYNSSGTSVGTVTMTQESTLDDFIGSINALTTSGNATLTNGVISISSGYITGDIADDMGIGYDVTENDTRTGITKTISKGITTSSSAATATITNTGIASGTVSTPDYVTEAATATSPTGFMNTVDSVDLTGLQTYTQDGITYTVVRTATQLQNALNTKNNVILANDINLSSTTWTSVANYNKTIDGNGYSISGLKFNGTISSEGLGLISNISETVTVKNLGIVNATVNNGSTAITSKYLGCICGTVTGELNIENCYIKSSKLVDNVKYSASGVGGLVGYCDNGTINISDTYVASTDVSGYNAGGLVGKITNNSELTTENTAIYSLRSTQNLVSNTIAHFGGTVGYVQDSSVDIESFNSYNTNPTENVYYAGGVIGYASNSTENNNITIADSYIYKTNFDATKSCRAGGTIGYADIKGNLILTNNILYKCSIRGAGAVGGMIGILYISNNCLISNCDIYDCDINADYSGSASGAPTFLSSGSIIGQAISYTRNLNISNCTIKASVYGYSTRANKGNIMGYLSYTGTGSLDLTSNVVRNSSMTLDDIGYTTTNTQFTLDTALRMFGVSTTNYIYVHNSSLNTDTTITITPETTFRNFVKMINDSDSKISASYTTMSNSIRYSIIQSNTSVFIADVTSQIKSKLFLTVGQGYTYSGTITTDYTATNSSVLSDNSSHSMTNSTTLGQLGFNTSKTFTTNGNNVVTIGVNDSIVTKLQNAGLGTSISNGQLTITGDSSHYLTSMDSALASALKINVGENYTYTVTGDITHSNTNSNPQNLQSITTLSAANSSSISMSDLGLGSNGTITTNNSVISISTTDMMSDVITKLGNAGITATINDTNGTLQLIGSADDYITAASNNLKNLLGLTTGNGYTYNTNTITTRADSTSRAEKYTRTYTVQETATENTKLNALTGGSLTAGNLVFSTGDGAKTINVSSDETIKSLRKKLANNGIATDFTAGKFTLSANKGDLTISDSTSNVSTLMGLTYNSTLDNFSTSNNINTIADDIYEEQNSRPSTIGIQVGINGNAEDVISIDTSMKLGRATLSALSSDSAIESLDIIDNMLNLVASKQTDFASASNRLESASESILTYMENLTSSLSTIRDADIAQESSNYIKSQILQQASATLLATANQTPAIALQLI